MIFAEGPDGVKQGQSGWAMATVKTYKIVSAVDYFLKDAFLKGEVIVGLMT